MNASSLCVLPGLRPIGRRSPLDFQRVVKEEHLLGFDGVQILDPDHRLVGVFLFERRGLELASDLAWGRWPVLIIARFAAIRRRGPGQS